MLFPLLLAATFLFEGLRHHVVHAAAFHEYSHLDHPLYTFSSFGAVQPAPVIMRRYYRHSMAGKTATKMRYLPNIATYFDLDANVVMTGLDALIGPNGASQLDVPASTLYEVHLTGSARVYILLSGDRDFRTANRPVDELPPSIAVTGLTGWGNPQIISNRDYKQRLPEPRGGGFKLPFEAVAVDRVYAAGETVIIPPVSMVTANGLQPLKITLLFAQPSPSTGTPLAFSPPLLPDPAAVGTLAPGAVMEPPLANTKCPTWLHDIHVVANDDTSGPAYWKTWHPIIDSVYWCYYDHDHGSFPGRYRPPFGYTAYRTPDSSTADGRQDESHNGFKVFSWEFGTNAVVATVHAHLALARRFTARKHTMVVAAFDVDAAGGWTTLFDFRMKADFGPAEVLRLVSKLVPATAEDAVIDAEMNTLGLLSGRRFNVINAVHNSGDDPVLFGRYEQWKAPIASCALAVVKQRGKDFGLQFDFRNAPTAMSDLEGATVVPTGRSGLSRDLLIHKEGITIGRALCSFDESESPLISDATGAFYTDSNFRVTKSGPGDFHVRQYMKPSFSSLTIPGGRLFMSDVWYGHFVYGTADKIFLENIEEAVDSLVN